MLRFGPAGWSYKDWQGIVYPQPKPRGFDALGYIAEFFDVIEVNSTFYRPARRNVAESWVERTSHNPRFRFTAKLWRRFTHERKTAWSADEVAQAREALEPLRDADRLGAVLIQFPWSFRNEPQSREWLDDVVRTFADFPLVLEVRHSSWNTPELFRELLERGVGFVNVDQPLFRDSIAPSARATSPVGYIRVHGRNYQDWWRKGAEPHERYDYLYSAEELEPWAERAREVAAQSPTEDVYVVTNNHYRGKGIVNALMLQSLVEGREVPGPEPLFQEYGEQLRRFSRPAAPEPVEH
jgi:uncharacterized protein YecE (DUF72 family)